MKSALKITAIMQSFMLFFVSCNYLTVNDVETGTSKSYPDLQPLELFRPYDEVFNTSREVISSLKYWKLIEADKEKGLIKAEVRTRIFRFVDDFTLKITDSNPVIVSARSKSRVGKGDFGKNAKNIRLFLRELQNNLENRQ